MGTCTPPGRGSVVLYRLEMIENFPGIASNRTKNHTRHKQTRKGVHVNFISESFKCFTFLETFYAGE